MRIRCLLSGVLLVLAGSMPAWAQNSRLFDRSLLIPIKQTRTGATEPSTMYGPTIDTASWIAPPLPPPREIRTGDLLTLRIDISQRTQQDGNLQRRKNATLNAQLRDWVVLEGLTQMLAAPQTSGEQSAQGTLNKQDRVNAQLGTMESLKMDIGAHVAAVLPNGNVVLEATRRVTTNEETWLVSVSGVCSKDAIAPGNLVLSKDVADLDIRKTELGIVKDSYRRGWLQRFWDMVKLF